MTQTGKARAVSSSARRAEGAGGWHLGGVDGVGNVHRNYFILFISLLLFVLRNQSSGHEMQSVKQMAEYLSYTF